MRTTVGIASLLRSGGRRVRRLAPAAAVACLLVAALGACGGKTTTSPPSSASSASVTVKLVTNPATTGAYDPQSVTIKAGQTVAWSNQDTIPHTVTADGGTFDSSTLNAGKSFTHTFTTAGTYPYHCTIHSAMHGTLIVQ